MLRKFEHLQALLPSYAIVAAMQPHRASHTAGASTPSANLQLAVISDPNVTRFLDRSTANVSCMQTSKMI